ncbi:hypothetical protein B4U79_00419, partial [Dinothrombium tinctorium]
PLQCGIPRIPHLPISYCECKLVLIGVNGLAVVVRWPLLMRIPQGIPIARAKELSSPPCILNKLSDSRNFMISLRQSRYNKQLNVFTLRTNLIANATAKNSEGRAGRIRSGNCFKLYSEEMENQMDDYSEPELFTTPLDSVVLQTKF